MNFFLQFNRTKERKADYSRSVHFDTRNRLCLFFCFAISKTIEWTSFLFSKAFFFSLLDRRLTSVESYVFIVLLQFFLRRCSHLNNINIISNSKRQKEMRRIFPIVVHFAWWAMFFSTEKISWRSRKEICKIPRRNRNLIDQWLIFSFLFFSSTHYVFVIVYRNWLVEPVKNKIGKP